MGCFRMTPKSPFLLKRRNIRMKRLGLANHGALVWKGLSKGLETPINIDIINHRAPFVPMAAHARSSSKRTLCSLCRLS